MNQPPVRLAGQPTYPFGPEPLQQNTVCIGNHCLAEFVDPSGGDDIFGFKRDSGLPDRVLDFRQYGCDGIARVRAGESEIDPYLYKMRCACVVYDRDDERLDLKIERE